MHETIFIEIAVVVMSSGLLSLLVYLLRQPLIIAYLITGLLIGPGLLDIAGSSELFGTLSDIGIAFLLFLVGLNLNWRNLREIGPMATVAGLGQIILSSGLGFFLLRAFDFDLSTCILGGLAFSFSSTIIIAKILSDKEDLDRLYGKIAVGILIVQDIVAMIALLVISAFAQGDQVIGAVLAMSAIKGVAVIFVMWILARFVLPHLFRYAARSPELLFLTALSWCFAVAAGLQFIGFSIEMGALLAGLSLAGSEFHREIAGKIKPLRDFFLIIFFIVLGAQLDFSKFESTWMIIASLTTFVLFVKPLVTMGILRLFRFHSRTGFLTGSTMAQVSEFSFILAALGIEAGLIDSAFLPLIIIIGMISIGLSTYAMKYNEQIYDRLHFLFRWTERREKELIDRAPEVILCGCDAMGEAMLPAVKSLKREYVVVDFNPAVIERLRNRHIPYRYGDIGSEEFLRELHAEHAQLIVSSIPDGALSSDILGYLKSRKSRATVVVSAKNALEAKRLYKLGAAYVIIPSHLSGAHAGEMLKLRKDKKASWQVAARKQKELIRLFE
ncbi:MAG: cation:proton antiporter [Patescibacteria group bacterium]|jgi:Kef-type K+ transport system membrane component KefB